MIVFMDEKIIIKNKIRKDPWGNEKRCLQNRIFT